MTLTEAIERLAQSGGAWQVRSCSKGLTNSWDRWGIAYSLMGQD